MINRMGTIEFISTCHVRIVTYFTKAHRRSMEISTRETLFDASNRNSRAVSFT